MPSGMVSLTKLARPHSDVVGLKVRVGKTAGAGGVRVDENSTGVCVTMAVGGTEVGCAFCAATVCATAVCITDS